MAEQATAPTKAPEKPTPIKSLSLLAREMYGDEFKGEVKPATEPEKPEPEAKPDAEGAEAEPEGEGNEEPEEGEAEGEAEPEGDEGKEESEGEPVQTVSEFLQTLEVDPEFFSGLKVQVKVDGKPAETTVADLVKSYQIGSAAEHRLEEAKSKAKAITEEAAAKSEALKGEYAKVAKLVEHAEAMLDQDAKAIDWAKLREDDPAEYAARKAEHAERRQRIETMKRDAVAAWQQQAGKTTAEQAEILKRHIQAEQAALLEKLPEWRDDAKAKADKAKLADYLLRQGFTSEDIMGASDHRLILVARKAMLYDEGKGKVETARKKLAKVPKVMKPGAAKPKEQIDRERLEQLRLKARKSGRLEDAQAYLKAKRGG